MTMIILDLFIVGLIGWASVTAFKGFWRSGNGSQPLLLVTVVALLGVAGLLQLVKVVTPAASGPAVPAPAPSSPGAERKEPQFVYDLPHRDQLKYDSETGVLINDKPRPARGMQLCVDSRPAWEYVLEGRYATFETFLKLDGPSSAGAVVNVEVFADDKFTVNKQVKGGDVEKIEMPLKDIKQLRLMASFIQKPVPCGSLIAQWVDAKVVPN